MQCAFRATSEARVRICAWKNVFEYPLFADRSRTMFLVLFDFRMFDKQPASHYLAVR